ncbi:mycoredoxin [Corynebacterium otitidis]|uniref:Glutaredoxin-like protein n=2 Tax=Corynebacterium otitidis ATCC 51513 TaxID=883169 RepID=K0YEP4_9CORY|nr:mycoredoxin [Corynebacterium otitidis]EJZ81992.1 glutaredoxin-like protein [Corynebacterium otitidis ATCC 51513]KKO83301.1 glutaredoxin [Corynebacterium otitidis]
MAESTEHVTVYATSWCPFCAALRDGLAEKDVPYREIDVEKDDNAEEATEWVKSVNDGNRVVPTVRYSDGTSQTNPPAEDVAKKYAELSA